MLWTVHPLPSHARQYSFSPCRDAPKDAADIATQRLGIILKTCCSLLGWCLLSEALLLLAPSSSQFSHITGGSELSTGRSTVAHVVNVSIKSLPTRRMPSPNLYLSNQQTIFPESRKKNENSAPDNLRISLNQIQTGGVTFVSNC